MFQKVVYLTSFRRIDVSRRPKRTSKIGAQTTVTPGLIVMGGDSCSEGRGLESQQCLLDGHFSHIFAEKIIMFV